MDRFSHDYSHIAKKFKIPTIESLFIGSDLIFAHKCIHHNYLKDENSIFTLKAFPYSQRRHFILHEQQHHTLEIKHTTTF